MVATLFQPNTEHETTPYDSLFVIYSNKPLTLLPCFSEMPASQSHLSGGVLFAMITSLALPCLKDFKVCFRPRTYFPDFMTRANREFILSIAFF